MWVGSACNHAIWESDVGVGGGDVAAGWGAVLEADATEEDIEASALAGLGLGKAPGSRLADYEASQRSWLYSLRGYESSTKYRTLDRLVVRTVAFEPRHLIVRESKIAFAKA